MKMPLFSERVGQIIQQACHQPQHLLKSASCTKQHQDGLAKRSQAEKVQSSCYFLTSSCCQLLGVSDRHLGSYMMLLGQHLFVEASVETLSRISISCE